MKIKKGDKIKVISGKDRGKTAVVIKAFPRESKILAEGVFLVKKHRKPKKSGEKGERITIPRPFNVSNAQLICPKCGKATRVGYRVLADKKFRICKKCQAEI